MAKFPTATKNLVDTRCNELSLFEYKTPPTHYVGASFNNAETDIHKMCKPSFGILVQFVLLSLEHVTNLDISEEDYHQIYEDLTLPFSLVFLIG